MVLYKILNVFLTAYFRITKQILNYQRENTHSRSNMISIIQRQVLKKEYFHKERFHLKKKECKNILRKKSSKLFLNN